MQQNRLGMLDESELLEEITKEATLKGLVVVAAAGNLDTKDKQYPAADDCALAITSVGSTSIRSTFANYGSWISVAAPGEGINSALPPSGYGSWSGTSMSTPFAAGQAALINSVDPTLNVRQVAQLIGSTALPLDTLNPDFDGDLGAGQIDIGQSLQILQTGNLPDDWKKLISGSCVSDDSFKLMYSGIIDAKPVSGDKGEWVVSGLTFTADTSTEFRTDNGPLNIDVCAEVEYIVSDEKNIAKKIASKNANDCSSPSTQSVHGLLEMIPTGNLTGTWTISGTSYEATAATQFEQEHGGFEVDRCVEVEYRLEGETRIATKIETERQHDCSSPVVDNEAFGTIQALPDGDTIGIWTIGGLPYMVSTATTLEDGPFFVGLLVEVHFSVAADGSLNATRIEGKPAVSDDDQALAFAYGLIDVMPGSGFIGLWQIGGVSYDATANTKFEQDEGAFAIDACAKVRYQSDNGTNVAVKIETEPASNCPAANGMPLNRTFGFVNQMPPTGLVGTWVIAGLNYDTRVSTQFKEENGVLVNGAYVGVHYFSESGVQVVQEIETYVPPEAGGINAVGQLQISSLQRIDMNRADTWQIDGQAYTITVATLLDDSQGDLVNGQRVSVNAFEQDGGRVATKVIALGDGTILYLPIVIR